jgi:hypothetical protein
MTLPALAIRELTTTAVNVPLAYPVRTASGTSRGRCCCCWTC